MHERGVKSVIAGLVICLLSLPAAAQQAGPLSDDDFITLNQQIKELKNPTFRAFLRTKLLSFESPEAGPVRRQAAMEVATQGAKDLCEHQDEVWSPTASWLHGQFVKQIKTLQSPEETPVEICVFKTGTTSKSATDLSSAIKMLSNPETNVAGVNLARSTILSGQVPADSMLGQLVHLRAASSPHLSELLGAVVALEEKQPGALPLRLMPFFSSVFLDKSVSPETLTRFLAVAVRSSRVSAEELAKATVRGPISELLNGIIGPSRRLAPALYPEIASRLSSLNRTNPNRAEMRLAAEERIQKASDQLEQLIAEANATSDESLKLQFLLRAARLAKEQGQLNKAVDLATKAVSNSEYWLNDFMLEIVSQAIKKQSPADATYAISKMTRTLAKVRAFRLLGEHYGATQDKVKSKEAFNHSARELKSVANNNEKVRASLALAESVLKYEPSDAYEVFRESVKAINNLPSPEKDHEKMYYVHLLPVAEDLIRSFRLLGASEYQIATNLADEIKLLELRLSALSGVYSVANSNKKSGTLLVPPSS